MTGGRRGTCERCRAEGRLELVDGQELCRRCARRARRDDGDQLRLESELVYDPATAPWPEGFSE